MQRNFSSCNAPNAYELRERGIHSVSRPTARQIIIVQQKPPLSPMRSKPQKNNAAHTKFLKLPQVKSHLVMIPNPAATPLTP